MGSPDSVKTLHRQIWLNKSDPGIRIYYMECLPPKDKKGTILLIHGFPESSYQFRYVMGPLAQAGYHIIAPDYRGHGFSSRPLGDTGYTKKELANDLFQLVTTHVGVKEKIHVVGHDIGGMIAHAYVVQFPDHVANVVWGECPLPGTTLYNNIKHDQTVWHFDFQTHHPDIAVALVSGKERTYLKHFYDRLAQNAAVFTPDVLDFYTMQYSMADALRCAFLSYRAFETDAFDNEDWREKHGKVKVRSMILSGDRSFIAAEAEGMANEMYEDVKHGLVEDSGHYLAEENPESFVKEVLNFIEA